MCLGHNFIVLLNIFWHFHNWLTHNTSFTLFNKLWIYFENMIYPWQFVNISCFLTWWLFFHSWHLIFNLPSLISHPTHTYCLSKNNLISYIRITETVVYMHKHLYNYVKGFWCTNVTCFITNTCTITCSFGFM